MIDVETKDAWEVLVHRLGGFIRRRVPARDADDVVQDVLVRVHTRGGDVDDARFGPWVYAVARNAVADYFRRRSHRVVADIDHVPESAAPDGDDERALLACVIPFVARLPSPYREALTLVEIEGLTQQAAAEIVGVSLSGMKSRVQRGRRLLRAMFEECCALTFDVRGRVIDAERRDAPCSCEQPDHCR